MPAVVIDNGSSLTRAGFAGDDDPKIVFPSVLGSQGGIGKDAQGDQIWPIQHGEVTNWDGMETIWKHIFHDQLKVDVENTPVLLTKPILTPKETVEKMAQVMFERFGVPKLFVAYQPVLSLYASGRKTGVVVEIGHGVTQIVPVYAGYAIKEAAVKTELAGQQLTDYLGRLLSAKGHSLDLSQVTNIKETLAFLGEPKQQDYTLPDGNVIQLGSELTACPEALFTPSTMGSEVSGLHDLIKETISKCEIDTRRELMKSIVLAGGSTLFSGMSERLGTLTGPESNIVAGEHRAKRAWIGGSVLADLDTMDPLYLTKEEFQEGGAAAVHKKF